MNPELTSQFFVSPDGRLRRPLPEVWPPNALPVDEMERLNELERQELRSAIRVAAQAIGWSAVDVKQYIRQQYKCRHDGLSAKHLAAVLAHLQAMRKQ